MVFFLPYRGFDTFEKTFSSDTPYKRLKQETSESEFLCSGLYLRGGFFTVIDRFQFHWHLIAIFSMRSTFIIKNYIAIQRRSEFYFRAVFFSIQFFSF